MILWEIQPFKWLKERWNNFFESKSKIFKIIVSAIAIILIIFVVSGYFFIKNSPITNGDNNFREDKNSNLPEPESEKNFDDYQEKDNKPKERVNGVEIQKDYGEIECNFQEDDKCEWDGKNRFEISGEKQNIFKPKWSKDFPVGREMFLNRSVTSDFVAYLKFTPQNNNEISLTLNYGNYWRVIVGSGDYNQVIVQRRKEINDPGSEWINVKSKSGNRWIKRNSSLSARTPIKVQIASIPGLDSASLNINLQISGYLKKEIDEKSVFSEDYIIVVDRPGGECEGQLGIGILNVNNSVKLEELMLK